MSTKAEETLSKTDEKSCNCSSNGTNNCNEATAGTFTNQGDNTDDILSNQDNKDQSVQDERDELIKNLQNKVEELNDKYLRLFSEYDNARKRFVREKSELIKTASADLIESVLPVLDDLDRAYKNHLENPNSDTLLEGINLIRLKMKATLMHKGLEEIPSVGELFNTDLHEAVTNTPAREDKEKGKVIEELQKGYAINGRVIRYAKVVVAN